MKVNEANWERGARVVLGIVLMVLGFGVLEGTGGVILGIVGLVPLLTGVTGFCPLYALMKFSTNGSETPAGHQ